MVDRVAVELLGTGRRRRRRGGTGGSGCSGCSGGSSKQRRTRARATVSGTTSIPRSTAAVALVIGTVMVVSVFAMISAPKRRVAGMMTAHAWVQGARSFGGGGGSCACSSRQRWRSTARVHRSTAVTPGTDTAVFRRSSQFLSSSLSRLLATSATPGSDSNENNINDDDNDATTTGKNRKKCSKNNKKSTRKKFTVVDKIEQRHLDNLAAAFDELARKEGFDSNDALYADDGTFDDDFDFDDDDDDDISVDDTTIGSAENTDKDEQELQPVVETRLDPMALGGENVGVDYAALNTDGGAGGFQGDSDDDDDDMDARIAAATNDVGMGRVSVPKELDDFAVASASVRLRELGFQRERNPFGDDETPRKEQFRLVSDAMTCSACGADFQSLNETRPGYVPPEKFEIQVKLSKLEEMQHLQEKAESDEWSPEDEIEWLIQSSGGSTNEKNAGEEDVADIDIDNMAEEMGVDLLELSRKKVICKRCHGLQNSGKVDASLRPGWTDEPLLSQEKFRTLLQPIREKPAVIIALVDLFDFSGSVLPELDSIAGDNPVILAANKADLLPSSMGPTRVESWVRRELEYLGVKSLANVGGAVRLVSCKTGAGVAGMIAKARSLANEMDCDIYVVGAANAGKSTLLNHVLARPDDDKATPRKNRAGNKNARKGAVTTSPLPGTTLKFIKVDLGGGRNLFDTPGLLVPGTLTQLLTPEELKIVVPKK